MSKEAKDKIEQAAESYMNSVHSTEYKDREYSYRAFKVGAKSSEAKEHWQEGMINKEQAQEVIGDLIDEGFKKSNEGMYTEEEVKDLFTKLFFTQIYPDYVINWEQEDLDKWFEQNKKKQ